MSGPRYSIFAARAVFDLDLTGTEVRVLAALGTYADQEGWCHPAQTTLATRLGVTRQTISATIKKLVAKGYVATHARTAAGRGKCGLDYQVVTSFPRDDEEKPPQEQSEADAKKADVGKTRQRVTPTTALADVGGDKGPMSAHADNHIEERPHKNDTSSLRSEGARAINETATRGRAVRLPLATPPAPKPKATVAPEVAAAKRVYQAIIESGLLHDDVRGFVTPKSTHTALAPVIREFGEADVLEAALAHYRGMKRKDGGKYAGRVVSIIESGRLEELIQDRRKRATVTPESEITLDMAIKRVSYTGSWRETWLDPELPIYHQARREIEHRSAA